MRRDTISRGNAAARTYRRGGARPASRRATVLVAAIVCLLVILMMGGAILKNLAVQHRYRRDEQRHLQALWLADSATGRATALLERDASYTGETWQVELGPDARLRTGKVVIEVLSEDNQPDRKRVRIEAVWPDDPVHRSVQQREFVIHLKGEGETE